MADIIIAFGVQIRDWPKHDEVVDYLNKNATSAGASKWTYPVKNPVHTISMIYTKAEFAAALDKDKAIVIYDGHSREGQGPAFGPAATPTCPDKATYPVNPWGDNFRMCYDVVNVWCLLDILDHGTNPTDFSLPKNTKNLFVPGWLQDRIQKLIDAGKTRCSDPHGWREFSICWAKVGNQKDCNGVTPLAKRHYWRRYVLDYTNKWEFDTLVSVGSADLDATKLACSVLYMNSCTSKKHYYEPLARHKKKVKSSCVFYLTLELCSGQTTLPFLQAVLGGKDPVKDKAHFLNLLSGVESSGDVDMVE